MRLTTLMLALGAAGLTALPQAASAGRVDAAYIATPEPGGPPSAALSVNDLGEIYGTWEYHDVASGQASRVTGVMYPTWGLGQTIQNGFGSQNDLGHSVAGAFLNYGGNSVDLRTLFGAEGMIFFANSLNNHGTIVGELERGLFRQAFRMVLHPDWQGGNGSWSDSAKWDFGGLGAAGFKPGREHDVRIAPTTGSATVLGAGSATVRTLGIGAGTGSIATLNLNGGTTTTLAGTTLGANGVLTGNGRLQGGLTVDAGGSVQVKKGEVLQLAGPVHNGGTLSATGTSTQTAKLTVSGPVESGAGSKITIQHSNTSFTGGLTLGGQLQVVGRNQIAGPIKVTTGGLVHVTGGDLAIFRDKLELLGGSELRVDSRSLAAFLGRVYQRTGARITGSGMKFFVGGLSVGNSPGLGDIAGSATFRESNFYEAEIGGTTACTVACETDLALRHGSHDKLLVEDELHFGGTLALVSWQDFTAQAGQSFDLFDAATFSGAFDRIDASGFKLAAGTQLDYSKLYTTGEISVTAVPEPELPALVIAGLAVMGLVARRKQRAGHTRD